MDFAENISFAKSHQNSRKENPIRVSYVWRFKSQIGERNRNSQGNSSTVQPPPLPLSPSPGVMFHVKNVNDVGFIFHLLKYIYGFPHLDFGFFGFSIFQKTSDCLFMFSLRLRKKQIISCGWLLFKWEPVNVNFGKSLCSIFFWSSTL